MPDHNSGAHDHRADLDATPSQPPRAGFRPATRGERARMEGKPPPDGPPMNKKEREAEAIAYAEALAAELKETKPEPGRIRSEFELSQAVDLIKHRAVLTDLLCRIHNLPLGRDFYITDDARDDGGDSFISAPSWLATDIANAVVKKIDEINERLTRQYGIPQ